MAGFSVGWAAVCSVAAGAEVAAAASVGAAVSLAPPQAARARAARSTTRSTTRSLRDIEFSSFLRKMKKGVEIMVTIRLQHLKEQMKQPNGYPNQSIKGV
jgi:hypothetical protein